MLKKLKQSIKIINVPIFKGIVDILTYELLFLIILRSLLILLPHREHELIYYININLLYINACLIWMSTKYSDINKLILYLVGTWLTFTFSYSVFFLFIVDPINQWYLFSINYHILSVVSTSLQLLVSCYIFIVSITTDAYLASSVFAIILLSSKKDVKVALTES